jgi:hypothetical protein
MTEEAPKGNKETKKTDETVYCYCKRGPEGMMVECDSGSCVMKWFHFTCAGIEQEPIGPWLCKDCVARDGMEIG